MSAEVALFSRVIDYAGMFPPAALSLDESIRNYAEYSRSEDAWMLGRFVVPAERLDELIPYKKLFSSETPCTLSVLATTPDSRTGYFEALRAEVDRVTAFVAQVDGAFKATSIEFRLPARAVPSDGPGRAGFLSKAVTAIQRGGLEDVTAFFEVSVPDERNAEFEALVREMGAPAASNSNGVRIAAKIRCGGSTTADVPAVNALTRVLHRFAKHRVPWKATAGLHHPFRHRVGRNDAMHGFVNLLVASVLAHTRKLALPEVDALLADEDQARFKIGETVSWRGVRASADEVLAARTEFALSFGSCSFVEPRDGLRATGILS